MNNTTLIAIILALIIVAGGGYLLYLNNPALAPSPAGIVEEGTVEEEGSAGDTTTEAPEGGGVEVGVDVSAGSSPMSANVALTSGGFSPQTVTVRKGGTVSWVNQTGGEMWVASAMHPTHSVYSGTTLGQHCAGGTSAGAFDQCQNGSNYSFTFSKAGTWRYHNHLNPNQFGTVVVIE